MSHTSVALLHCDANALYASSSLLKVSWMQIVKWDMREVGLQTHSFLLTLQSPPANSKEVNYLCLVWV